MSTEVVLERTRNPAGWLYALVRMGQVLKEGFVFHPGHELAAYCAICCSARRSALHPICQACGAMFWPGVKVQAGDVRMPPKRTWRTRR